MSVPLFSDRILACLKAPGHSDDAGLEIVDGGLRCRTTGQTYTFIDGIPSLYQPSAGEDSSVTAKVRSFYEENPFPNYDGLEEFGELVHKGYENPFTTEILKAIGYNKTILECGCRHRAAHAFPAAQQQSHARNRPVSFESAACARA